ncbi:MAG TPA: hypothetical protein ENK39_07690 [Epsilonproteobacteria bacterium]|nr:hypothetical protein [Campylobacterota bacterium]
MKLWFTTAIALVVFTGCASRTQNLQLQNNNARQALLIQQQQAQIDALQAKLDAKAKAKRRQSAMPKAPKKNIKLKKVEDNNYSSGYMYPGEKKKKPIKVAQATTVSSTMDKAECIAMIGADKFEKYTQIFGSEAASIKRCSMLKAMKQ